jgi:hypothetical protein
MRITRMCNVYCVCVARHGIQNANYKLQTEKQRIESGLDQESMFFAIGNSLPFTVVELGLTDC